MDRIGIVFSGSGGQGVITAAIILAEAAVVHEGLYALQAQSYGPEARGGATRSDVIISSSVIHFPKVVFPNLLVALTQEAYNKYNGMVVPGATIITDKRYVVPKKNSDAIQKEFNIYDSVIEQIGNPVVLNICMLGIVIQMTHVVKPESVLKTLANRMNPKFLEMNEKALRLGIKMAE